MSVQWEEIDDEPMTLGEVLVAAAAVGCFFALLWGCCWLAVTIGHAIGRC